jgi:hypothetical protein
MKRVCIPLAVLALCLLLSACSGVIPTQYTQVSVHSETQQAQKDPDALTAESYSDLKRDIRSFVSNHVEHGVIRVYRYPSGKVENDLANAAYAISREDPLGAYAVDYMTHNCSLIVSFYEINIDITFRRTLQEINAIEYIGSEAEANALIQKTMDGYQDELTMYTTYYGDPDYEKLAQEYFDKNPGKLMAAPEVHVLFYPESGASRIAVLKFDWPVSSQKLRDMQQAVNDSLHAASVYVRYREKELDKAELLFTYLLERFSYKVQDTKTPVYSLLCQGLATSKSMADSWKLLCDQVGIDCVTVAGSRQGENYWWNIITLDGRNYHVDILSDVLGDGTLHTRSDGEMKDYYWDTSAYPACPAPPAAEQQAAAGETAQPAAGAETAQPAETPETPAEETTTEPSQDAGTATP